MVIALWGCEVKPSKINYGSDACHYCKMSIVDAQHASEIVTVKGKAFKYDAIECMMNHLQEWDQAEPKLYLVSDYDNPKSLIDATKAHYVISQAIPSPMGEFLTAFENPTSRDSILENNEGLGLTWEELKEEFRRD